MFKVNNKDTRMPPIYFTACSIVYIVNFEQANADLSNVFFFHNHLKVMKIFHVPKVL